MNSKPTVMFAVAAIIFGLILLSRAEHFSVARASTPSLAVIFGGDCFNCVAGSNICNDEPCGSNGPNYDKKTGAKDSDGNAIGDAVCEEGDFLGSETCDPAEEVTCLTVLTCGNSTCTLNCSSTVIKVYNGCTIAGSCDAGGGGT
jgi:hypothetical protein